MFLSFVALSRMKVLLVVLAVLFATVFGGRAGAQTLNVTSNQTIAANTTASYASIAVSNGATLTIGGGSTITVGGAVTVTGNSAIVIGSINNTAQVSGAWVGAGSTINAGSVQVDAGSSINADGQGYVNSTLQNQNLPGAGPGGASRAGDNGGASYGGFGGGVGGDGASHVLYGSVVAPVDLGSGGNCTAGGGAVRLAVSGTLTLNGTVSANGQASTLGCADGAGGSVWVTTQRLTGTGFFTANGSSTVGMYGHGGGGGRVSLSYASAAGFTGFRQSVAAGGVGLTDPGFRYTKDRGQSNYGHPGTVVFVDTTAVASTLNVTQNQTLPANSQLSYAAINVQNGATLTVSGGSSLYVSGAITVTGNSSIVLASINNTAQVNGAWSGMSTPITAGSVQVDAGSSLSADGQGYQPVNGTATGPGGPGSYGGQLGAGGDGYGDVGPYGFRYSPVDLGSSGPSSPGGGNISLTVLGTLTNNGVISANSPNVTSGYAGAGGGIYVRTQALAGGGSFNANGGSVTTSGSGGGGGRIAVIFADAQNYAYAGYSSNTVLGGAVAGKRTAPSAHGPYGPDGESGTLVLYNLSLGGERTGVFTIQPYTDANGNLVREFTFPPYTDFADYGAVSILVRGGVTAHIGGGSTINLPGFLTVTGNSSLNLLSVNNTRQVAGIWAGASSPITVQTVQVDAGSSLNADAGGYAQAAGPGATAGCCSAAGGSYGGAGGRISSDSSVIVPTYEYGQARQPNDLGSGGWNYGNAGGAGGGLLRMIVSGTTTLNGTISANGGVAGDYSGGGSGGSVYLTTATLVGSGTVHADGGSVPSNFGGDGGSGGGGRAYVEYTDATQYTGSAGSTANPGSAAVYRGTAGTVAFVNTAADTGGNSGNFGALLVDAPYTIPANTTATFDSITVMNGAPLTIGGGSAITVTGNINVTGNGQIQLGSINNTGQVNGKWVGQGSTLTAAGVSVDKGSSINADGLGYAIETGPGASQAPYSTTGGSYGGGGGRGPLNPDGSRSTALEYGLPNQPTDLGSGGWEYESNGAGAGGGSIQLTVTGALTLNGTISANGQSSTTGQGAGSGGSVYVKAGSLSGSGTFQANGGSSTNSQGGGAGGGGGRVAVYTPSTTGFAGFAGSTASGGGSDDSNPGNNAYLTATTGTIGFFDTSTATPSLATYQRFTLATSSTISYNNITAANSSTLVVGGGSTLNVAGTLLVTSNSTIEVDSINNTAQVNSQWAGQGSTINAANAQIDKGSVISADMQGYAVEAGPGAIAGADSTAGGSYGGAGGRINGDGSVNTSYEYGSQTAPLDLGSGGWQYAGAGGKGGGAIRLNVTGTLTLNGALSANGQGTTGYAGGGAGGSLYVTAGTLTGAGSLQATGGSGSDNNGANAGGGGGRVAVYSPAMIGFTGGENSTVAGGSSASNEPGTQGTLTFFDTSVPSNNVSIYGSYILPPNTNAQFNNLNIMKGGSLEVGGGTQLIAAQTLGVAGTMIAHSVNSTGQVNGSYQGKGIEILANMATVEATGSITADSQGFPAKLGPGSEAGPGSTAGGSYGGLGGRTDSNVKTYGSATLPLDLGSGGWAYSGQAGAGGGAIELLVSTTLTLNGPLSATGGNPTDSAGGGSGGSILVAANTVNGTGSVSANGGSHAGGASGGGGGGRVSMQYVHAGTFTQAAVSANGGTGDSGFNGANGTVNYQQQAVSQWILPTQPVIHDTAQLEWFTDAGGTTSVSLAGPRTQQIATGAGAISTAIFDTTAFPDGAYQLRLSVYGANAQVLQTITKDEVINNSVIWHSGTLTTNTEWAAGKVHALDGNVVVPNGITLTIDPGAIVKALPGTSILVQSGGVLNALGTASAPVIFTTFDDISIGGNTEFNAGTSVPQPGEWQGIVLQGTGVFNSNGNTQVLYTQAFLSGTLPGNQSLLGTRVYTITGTLTVPNGITLNIQPGAVVKFASGAGIDVQTGGTLNASGTLAQPIYLTSINDNSIGGVSPGSDGSLPIAGDWNSIEIDGGTATFNYVHMLYGGGPQSSSAQAGMIETGNNAKVTIANSELAYAFFIGLQTGYPNGGGDTITVTNTTFHSNEDRAINTYTGSTVHIVNDTFDSNAAGVFNHGGTVDVENSVITSSSNAQFGSIGICCGGTFAKLSYNDVYTTAAGVGNYVGLNDQTGTNGNISAAPVYMNGLQFDYRPTYGSPLIDAADGTVANYSPTDALNDLRYNNPQITAKAGKADVSGNYPDIGAFEFVQSAPSNLDLTVSNVQGPITAVVGQQVQITYTVTNIGQGTATGPWHDSAYLAAAPNSNGAPVRAGTVLHGQGVVLGPGASVQETVTVTVPGTVVGQQQWQVRTNVLGEVFEGANTANNAANSLDRVAIDLQQIVPGGSLVSGSFAGDGATSYYKVVPVPTQTTQVQLALNGSLSGAVELFVGSNYVPTPQHYDYVSTQFNQPNVSVVIPSGSTQTYYVAAYAQNLTSAPAAFSISATSVSFSLTGAAPGSVPNAGDHTFAFIGGGFNSSTNFSLVDAVGDIIAPTAVYIADATHADVTFHFNYAQGFGTITKQGTYDATATNGTQTITLPGAVQVLSQTSGTSVAAGTLMINLDVPQAFRAGFPAMITVNYTNISGYDAPAPLMFVSATNATLAEVPPNCSTCSTNYAAQYQNTFASGLVLAISSQGPAGILPAGGSGSIQFMATPTGASGSASFAATEAIGDIVGTQLYQETVDYSCPLGYTCSPPPAPHYFGYSVGGYATAAAFCSSLVSTGQPAGGATRACMQMLNNAGYTYAAPQSGIVVQPGICSSSYGINCVPVNGSTGNVAYVYGHLTAKQLSSLLAADATALSAQGNYEYDVQKLIAFELNKDGFSDFNKRYHQGVFGYGSGDSFGITGDMSTGSPTLHYSDGTTQSFPLVSSTAGVYLGAVGDASTLTVQSDGSWLVQVPDGTAIHLVASGQIFQLDSITDRNNNKSTYTYSNSLLTNVTDGYGNTLAYKYDSLGHVTSTIDNYAYTQSFTYSTLSDTAKSTFLTGVTTPTGTTSFTYQTAGIHGPGYIDDSCIATYCETPVALTGIAYPDGTHQSFTYDGAGRLASSAGDQGSNTHTYTYGADGTIAITDGSGGVTTLSRNVYGSIATVTDPLGAKTIVKYDAEGKPVSRIGALGDSTSSDYDGAGNVNAATSARGSRVTAAFNMMNLPASLTDPMGSPTTYGFDSQFNPTSEVAADGSQRTAAYNGNGLITSRTNARGQTQTFSYDSKGRLATKTLSTGAQLTYTYDINNQLQSVTGPTGSETFSYDSAGRTTGITHGNGTSVKYIYNALGQLSGQSDSTGFALTYTYDAAGRLATVASASGTIASYTYDKLNRLSVQKMGNGTSTQLSYDLAGNMTAIKHLNAANATLDEYDYTYDSEGAVVAAATSAGTVQYTYDLDHQLTTSAGGGQSVQYAYDASGNRTSSALGGSTTAFAANNLNQYSSAGAHSYRYDTDGNLVADNTTAYTYDEENRLTGIQNGNDTWVFTYDALGQRASTTHNGQTTSYLMGIGSMEAATTSGGTEHYAYGYGLTAEIGSDGSQDFYHFDNNGNTVLLTDRSGAAVNGYSYLPFGEKTTQAAGVANLFTFSGQFGAVDDGTGLYHMRNRWYSPGLGRFLQQDPVGASGGVNRYTYVSNSPTNLVDPKGLCGAYVTGNVSGGLPSLGKVSFGISANLQTGDLYFGSGGSPGAVAAPEANAYVGAGYVPDSTTAADNTGNCGDQVNNVLDGQSGSVSVTAPGGLTVTQVGGSSGGATEVGLTVGTKDVTGGISGGIGNSTHIGKVPILRYSDENHARDREVDETRNWIQWKQNAQRARDGHLPLVLVPLCPTCLTKGTPNPVSVPVRGSIDPNSKLTSGYGDNGYVPAGAAVSYTVYFENQPTATAPAQKVTVTDQLSSSFDWSTVQFTSIAFNNATMSVPVGTRTYHSQATVSTDPNPVTVSASLNPSNGQLRWTMQSVDPITQGTPANPLAGFLPPNNSANAGVGSVTFTVVPKAGLANGAVITNQAAILFDANAPIVTNTVMNTLDTSTPTSAVNALPAITTSKSFTVGWTGIDPSGSGIASYNIYVAIDGGSYSLWLSATTATSATFTGANGHSYTFVSLATSNVGTSQTAAGISQTTNIVTTVAPTITVKPAASAVAQSQTLSVTISVAGTPTPTGSVILSSGSYSSGGAILSGGIATIVVPAGSLAIGTDTLTASFIPDASSSGSYAAGTGTAQITVSGPTVPTVSLAPASLTFTSPTGMTSAAQTVTLTNSGNVALTIGSVTLSGVNATSFAQTNNCGTSLVAGGNCNISVTFAPAATGAFTAALIVADNATGSPQMVTLSGTATAAPTALVSLVPSSLTFTAASGTTAAAQTVTLSNTGNAALGITNIAITGTNPADFAQTNTCGTSLASNASCTIQVSFTPNATGSRVATLSITDNAAGSPHTVSLLGTVTSAATFTLTVTPTSQTVSRGSVATYLVTVTPQGGTFTRTVTFSVAGLPVSLTPVFSPTSVIPASGAVTSTLTIPTSTLQALMEKSSPSGGRGLPVAPLLAGGVLLMAGLRKRRRLLTGCVLAFATLIASATFVGCGSQLQTYSLVISGTSAASGAVAAETEKVSVTLMIR